MTNFLFAYSYVISQLLGTSYVLVKVLPVYFNVLYVSLYSID